MDFDLNSFHNFCYIALAIVVFQIFRKVLPWLYLNVFGPMFFGPKVDVRRMGDWAVVTGATDGIGKAYANALAKKGMNIVLISRSLEKLDSVAKEIGDAHKVQIIIVDVDFTGGPEIYEKIEGHLQGLDIGVLVNNVGINFGYPEYFLDCVQQKPSFLRDIIAANIHSVTHMSSIVMPRMVAKNMGVIINVSSTAAIIPNPLLCVYSATKAFIDKFSVELQTEYADKGIIIQSVQPGYVATNMSKIRRPTTMSPSADVYVASALRSLGIAQVTAGYAPHALLQLSMQIISAMAGSKVANNVVFNSLKEIRARALKNLNKSK